MKAKPALFLLALPLSTALAAENNHSDSHREPQVAHSNKVTPGSILAAQIQAIVETRDLSDESKSRQIAAAIRLAITTTLKNVTDPREATRAVLELTQAATEAAPKFADLIFRTVTTTARDIPVLAAQPGLAETIRAAVSDAVRDAGDAAGGDRGRGDRNNDHHGDNDDHDFHGHGDDHIVSPSH
jgi:hypothetical protein